MNAVMVVSGGGRCGSSGTVGLWVSLQSVQCPLEANPVKAGGNFFSPFPNILPGWETSGPRAVEGFRNPLVWPCRGVGGVLLNVGPNTAARL